MLSSAPSLPHLWFVESYADKFSSHLGLYFTTAQMAYIPCSFYFFELFCSMQWLLWVTHFTWYRSCKSLTYSFVFSHIWWFPVQEKSELMFVLHWLLLKHNFFSCIDKMWTENQNVESIASSANVPSILRHRARMHMINRTIRTS